MSYAYVSMRTLSYALIASGAALVMVGCGADASDNYSDFGGRYAPAPMPAGADYQDGETYDEIIENDFIEASQENTSTFSIDVDTASYTVMRRDINNGVLPSPESVRTEEYINYFDYDYPEPADEHPFSVNMEVAPSRFGEGLHLMRVGVKGEDIHPEDLRPTALTFLIDVSGSMQSEAKLPLVKQSLNTLIDNLRPDDTIGIVVYAGADGVVLPHTPAREAQKIKAAIDNLGAGGSTNAEAGIVTAYEMAEAAKKEAGNNRVIILTDGDFNVGKTGEQLFDVIEEYREKEISLTCMGYGLGNYNDYHMENLSNKGNGNYFYVDSIDEAKRVFGTELSSTLEVIAADVKIQVEFNQDAVAKYRLVGYENRVLDNEDFDDDSVDAGEIGPGHTVTAYYELELSEGVQEESLLSTVRLRYKSQYGDESNLIERAIKLSQTADGFDDASESFRFAAAVIEFAEILRGSKHVDEPDMDAVIEVATDASAGTQKEEEFLELASKASTMKR